MELTILMPCCNEAATVVACIAEAKAYLTSRGIAGEVLVADNASMDASRYLAEAAGAEVIFVPERGYGHAVRGGISGARGKYIIMGDCDGSYDFSHLDDMLACLRDGWDLVIGNRFLGGIQPGAMPFLHRYVGVPMLSFLGRIRFRQEVGDFHCGLRGFSRESAAELTFHCGGMEFATEMIGRYADAGKRICQVPVPLRRDLRNKSGHLRTVRDGMRHLCLILFWDSRMASAFLRKTRGNVGKHIRQKKRGQ